MKRHSCDILIVGGGAPGLTLGIILAKAGIDVAILDPAAHEKPPALADLKPDGRTVALMNNSLKVLESTGVLDDVSAYGAALKTMRLYDDSIKGKAPVISNFHARDIGRDQFGLNIPNAALNTALKRRAQNTKNLSLITGSLKDFDIEQNRVRACLDTQKGQKTRTAKNNIKEIDAALIVGADGRASKTREAAGIDSETHHYGQTAMTFLISHDKAHNNISTEFHRPGGPMALVPLPGGHTSSVVWVEKSETAEHIHGQSQEEFTQIFQDKTRDILGSITLESRVERWPLCAITASRLTAERTALMAEAAHVMSPITAQGLNLSLRDVAALSDIIIEHMQAGYDPGSANILTRYSRARQTDIATRTRGVDGMMRLVSQDHPGVKTARRTGLKLLDSLPPLKKLMMREGLAPRLHRTRS